MSILNSYRRELSTNPNMKQKDICKNINISQSTISRYQKDLGVNSFHRLYTSRTRNNKVYIPNDPNTFISNLDQDKLDLAKELITHRKQLQTKRDQEEKIKEDKKQIRQLSKMINHTKNLNDLETLVSIQSNSMSTKPKVQTMRKYKHGAKSDSSKQASLADKDIVMGGDSQLEKIEQFLES